MRLTQFCGRSMFLSMFCGQRRAGPSSLSDECKFHLFGSDGKHFIRRQTEERLNPECVKKSVKGGGGRVMVWGMFSAAELGLLTSYMAGECKCLSEPPSAKCSFFPASISQSACNFHAGQCPCHTANQVKQFLEAKNIEIINGQSPDLNPIENLWRQVMAKKTHNSHRTVEETGRKVDQDHTSTVWETSDVLRPQMCWSHSKQGPVHFLLISDSCNPPKF